MSQLSISMSKLESQGKMPSQTVPSPKQNASAVILRSGKELKTVSSKKLAQGSATGLMPEIELKIQIEKQLQK